MKRLAAFLAGLTLLYVPLQSVSRMPRFEGTYIQTQRMKLEHMRQGTPYEVVVLGDSTAMPIDPTHPVTRERLPGRTMYNYALVNLGGIYPLVSTLERQLASAQAPPRVILLAFLPSMVNGRADIVAGRAFTKFYASHFYDMRDMLDDEVIRSRPPLLAAMLLHKARLQFSPMGYDIPYLRELVDRPRTHAGQFLILEHTRATSGAVETAPEYGTRLQPSAQSVAFLERLLTRAEAVGSQVLLFLMPDPETGHRRRVDSGFYASYWAFLEELACRHRNLRVLPRDFSVPDDAFASDVTHLNRWGTERFHREIWPVITDRVAELLDKPLSPPRAHVRSGE